MRRARQLRTTYRVLGALMVVAPAIAAGLAVLVPSGTQGKPTLFLVEAAGVFTFAAYWLTKSREMSATNAERLALERKLRPAAHAKPAESSTPGRLVQIEPDDDPTTG